jgi:uncharacterized protein (DUF885 family)
MTDYSGASEERIELDRTALRELSALTPASERERVSAEVMRYRLSFSVALYELGEHLRDLNVLGSPVQGIRQVFDQMPTATEHDWATIAARIGLVPEGLSSLQAAYDEGVAQGLVAARRQVVGCAPGRDLVGTDGAHPAALPGPRRPLRQSGIRTRACGRP